MLCAELEEVLVLRVVVGVEEDLSHAAEGYVNRSAYRERGRTYLVDRRFHFRDLDEVLQELQVEVTDPNAPVMPRGGWAR